MGKCRKSFLCCRLVLLGFGGVYKVVVYMYKNRVGRAEYRVETLNQQACMRRFDVV